MIVACSACATRFEASGYRDPTCPRCGAIGQPAAHRPCPRCDLPLEAREIEDVVIDECSHCRGLFLDQTAIARVVEDEQQLRAASLLAALPRTPHHPMPPAGARMYIKCPTCSTVMNRKLFATGSGVVVDVCKTHGTFFDAGELPAIIEFVQRGGLVEAAKKDAERERQRASREQKARQAAAVPAAFQPVRDESPGAALIDLLLSLFG